MRFRGSCMRFRGSCMRFRGSCMRFLASTSCCWQSSFAHKWQSKSAHLAMWAAPLDAGQPIDGRQQKMLLRHCLKQGLSRSAVAAQLGICRRTLYNWIDRGELDRDLDEEAAHQGPVHDRPEWTLHGVGCRRWRARQDQLWRMPSGPEWRRPPASRPFEGGIRVVSCPPVSIAPERSGPPCFPAVQQNRYTCRRNAIQARIPASFCVLSCRGFPCPHADLTDGSTSQRQATRPPTLK